VTVLLFVVLVLVLAAERVNGWHDASNVIAAHTISTAITRVEASRRSSAVRWGW
jgi:hypothetical protein